ncbi:hypothetical protein Tco_0025111 [Tanacetum coccineum]|uniref:Uncharacterized protein n=1 Tax=Tanacetum coccineum TaxID=301880 RepID=A0ABQ5A2M5_9ASTR
MKDDLEAMILEVLLSSLRYEVKRECRAPRSKEGQFRNQDNTRKQGNNEDTSSKEMLVIDGVGIDSNESLVEAQVSQGTSSFVEFPLNVDKETVFPVDKKGNQGMEWTEVQSTMEKICDV